jgi:hypothetical protein
MQPTSYDVFEFSLAMSNITGIAYDSTEASQFCQSLLQEEISSTVDRSRLALGTMVSLNFADLLSDPNSIAHHAAGMGALLLEMTIRLSRPQTVLFGPFAYRGLDINHATLQEVNVSRVDIMNAPNLDYAERFWGLEINEDHLVLQQDIQSGTVGKTYDLISLYLETVMHDDNVLLNLAEMLNPGGTMFLMGTSDSGAIYVHKDAHPFHHPHELLKSQTNLKLFFIPVGLGYTIVTKSL